MKFTTLTLLAAVSSASAFSPFGGGPKNAAASQKQAASAVVEEGLKNQKPIFDPLGLYSKNSPERAAGIIKPLETPLEKDSTVVDPLGLYPDKSTDVSLESDRSASLPFLKRPAHLDGTLPGDRGFDPFNFSSGDASTLQWYRDSELRHSRIAMLAVVGWIAGERFHTQLAGNFDLPSMLQSGKVPSVLNGGLDMTSPLFWVGVLSATAAVEFLSIQKQNAGTDALDFGFDPLGLGGKTEKQQFFMKEAEIFNGRLAMLAITGFAMQEAFTNMAVIDQTPIFFKPFAEVVSTLMGAAGTSV